MFVLRLPFDCVQGAAQSVRSGAFEGVVSEHRA
jgi:hypothetical protein